MIANNSSGRTSAVFCILIILKIIIVKFLEATKQSSFCFAFFTTSLLVLADSL